jgi:hypothetical protein
MRRYESNTYVRTILVIIANLILWMFLLNSHRFYLNTSLLIAGGALLISYLYIRHDYVSIFVGDESLEVNYRLSVFFRFTCSCITPGSGKDNHHRIETGGLYRNAAEKHQAY